MMAIGSKTADWTLTYDETQLPDGWTFELANSAPLHGNSCPTLRKP